MKKSTLIVLFLIIGLLLSGCNIFEASREENPLSLEEEGSPEDIEGSESTEQKSEVSQGTDENTRQVTLYYRDSGGYTVPVVRTMPKVEGVATAALSALVDTTENRNDLKLLGLEPVLPTNTEVELAIKEEGLVRANFSEEILNVESKAQEESMVSSIVYTLTEFPNIDKVQVMVNNEVQDTLTYGTEVGEPIGRGNINALNNAVEEEHSKLTLYMYNNPTGQYTYFVPITKNIPASARNVETAIQELVATKGEVSDLQLDIPEGSKVQGVDIESGVAHVRFSEHLAEMTDPGEVENLTKAIGLTLKEFGGVDGVRLSIDGQNNEMSSEAVSVPTFANTY